MFGNICSAYAVIIAPNETFDKCYKQITLSGAEKRRTSE